MASTTIMGKIETPHKKFIPKEYRSIIKRINQQIKKYNKTSNDQSEKDILQRIQSDMRTIDHGLPDSKFEQWQSFTAMQAELFKAIQFQQRSLGRKSALDPASLPEIMANMSPEKVNKLLEVLNKKNPANNLRKDLGNLYSQKDMSQEAQNFSTFLKDHTITFLGGDNSKNIKVEHSSTGNKLVLKVDNRLNRPRATEDKLRAKEVFNNRFTPAHAERRANYESAQGEIISRTLLVNDYFEGGSVKEYCGKFKDDVLLNEAGKIFTQMVSTMLDFQENNFVFSDAKTENWLVDSKGNILISDTKSFLDLKSNESELSLHYTEFFSPPEFKNIRKKPSADPTHAYILGKNLYFALGGGATKKHNGSEFKFNKPEFINKEGVNLFETEKGEKFKTLIEDLVKRNPDERLSIQDAHDRLFLINNSGFKNVLTELKGLKKNKKEIKNFIRAKQREVIDDPDNSERVLGELNSYKDDQKRSPDIEQKRASSKGENQKPSKNFSEFKKVKTALLELSLIENDSQLKDYIELKEKTFNQSDKSEQVLIKKMQEEVNKRIQSISDSTFAELNKFKFGDDDQAFNEYIEEQKRTMSSTEQNSTDKIDKLADMKKMVDKLEEDGEATRLKNIIEKYRAGVKWYTIGKRAKANRIESAIAELPLAERWGFLKSLKSEKATVPEKKAKAKAKVMKALASHRAIGKQGKVYTTNKDQEINPRKAARQFKNFKEKIEALQNQDTPPQPKKSGPKPP